MVLVVKNPPTNVRHIRDVGLIPGSGRLPGGGHGNPLQFSCPKNPMDRGGWWATVHSITKSRTQQKQLSMHAFSVFIPIYLELQPWQNSELCSSRLGYG